MAAVSPHSLGTKTIGAIGHGGLQRADKVTFLLLNAIKSHGTIIAEVAKWLINLVLHSTLDPLHGTPLHHGRPSALTLRADRRAIGP